MTQAETPKSSQPMKRRRIGKSPASSSHLSQEVPASAAGPTSSDAAVSKIVRVRYERCFQDLLRTRAYARDAGAQCGSRRVQRILCPDTHDLDIENSIFCLLSQLLHKLDQNKCLRADVLEIIDRCARDRAGICRQELKVSLPEGKRLLQQILFGRGVPISLANNQFIQGFQRAAIYLRWLACSLLPEVHACVQSLPEKKILRLQRCFTCMQRWKTTFSNPGKCHFGNIAFNIFPCISMASAWEAYLKK